MNWLQRFFDSLKPIGHGSEPCSFCGQPLLEYPYCRCDYLGFTRTEAERRRQRIRSAIGMPESGRA
jgi:hypothetical protein